MACMDSRLEERKDDKDERRGRGDVVAEEEDSAMPLDGDDEDEEDDCSFQPPSKKTTRTFVRIDTVNLHELLRTNNGRCGVGSGSGSDGAGDGAGGKARHDPMALLDSLPLPGGSGGSSSGGSGKKRVHVGGAAPDDLDEDEDDSRQQQQHRSRGPFKDAKATAEDRRLKAHALVIKKATEGMRTTALGGGGADANGLGGGGGSSSLVDVISIDGFERGNGREGPRGVRRKVAGPKSNLQVDVEFDLGLFFGGGNDTDDKDKSGGGAAGAANAVSFPSSSSSSSSPSGVSSSAIGSAKPSHLRPPPTPILPPQVRVVDSSLRAAFATFDLRPHLKLLFPPSSASLSYPGAFDHTLSTGEGSALHLCALLNDVPSASRLLLARSSGGGGACAQVTDGDGLSPGEAARLAGNDTIAEILFEAERREYYRCGGGGNGGGASSYHAKMHGGGNGYGNDDYSKGGGSSSSSSAARDARMLLQAGGEDVVYDVFCAMDDEPESGGNDGDDDDDEALAAAAAAAGGGGGSATGLARRRGLATKHVSDMDSAEVPTREEVEVAGHFDPETGDLVLDFEDYSHVAADSSNRLVSEEDDYDSNDEDAVGNDYPDEEDDYDGSDDDEEEGEDGADNVARSRGPYLLPKSEPMDSSDDEDGQNGTGNSKATFRNRPVDLGPRGMRAARGTWGGKDAAGNEEEDEDDDETSSVEDGNGGYGNDGDDEETEMYAYDPELEDE